jgi:putative ABC transport system permease protein
MYAFKTLVNNRGRYFITSFGIGLCITLMLFLLAIFRGVSDGCMRYINESDADLWILQKHTSNIMRGTSLLMMNQGNIIKGIPGVKQVAPVFFFSSSVKTHDASGTVRLTGYDINTGRGGPPEIFKGKALENDNQIILDRSFAIKYELNLEDKITMNEDTLIVTGFSAGTNMGVYQYAFVTLKKAQSLIGLPGIVSFFQVRIKEGSDPREISELIKSSVKGVAVLDRKTFLQNNQHEMESGFLPMLYVIALIGAIVLTAILSLILSVYIMEQRLDYTIIKALGAPGGFIPGVVLRQAFILAFSGMVIAVILFFPLLKIVGILTPEVVTETSAWQIFSVFTGLLVISLISSFFPILKLRHIYPLELFK